MEGQKAATGITGIMNSTMAGADRGAKEDIAELSTLATTFWLYIQQSLDFTCLLW